MFLQIIPKFALRMNTSRFEIFFCKTFEIILKCLLKTPLFEAKFLSHLKCFINAFIDIDQRTLGAVVCYFKTKDNR